MIADNQPEMTQSSITQDELITRKDSFLKLIDPRKDDVPFKVGIFCSVGEFVGTFVFVFWATEAVVISNYVKTDQILSIAFGQGFALSIAIFLVAPVSGGHLNPAVTISALCVRRITLIRALLYIIAQFSGAIVASALVRAITPDNYQGNIGATCIHSEMSTAAAFFLELIMTMLLVIVLYSTAIDPRGMGRLAPLAIGLVVIVDEIIGASWTGASMNPARTLGPALISNHWCKYWLYFLAPTFGAILGAFAYEKYMEAQDEFRGFLPNEKFYSRRKKESMDKRNKKLESKRKCNTAPASVPPVVPPPST